MSLTEIQNLIVVLQTKSGQYDRDMSKSRGVTNSFTQSAKLAAGILLRDLVRGFTTSAVASLKLGAKMETISKSFRSLTAAQGEYVPTLEEMRKATRGMVSNIDLLTQANTAMVLGLPTENLDQLFDSAIRVGKAVGLDAKKAVESLTTGIGRQSRMVLDNLGVIVKAEEAYEEYAQRLGKTSSELTDNERKMAFMTIAIEKVTDKANILGDNISETEKKTEQWSAAIKNLSTDVGQFLSPLGAMTPLFETMAPAISLIAVQMLPQLGAALKTSSLVTTGWGAVTISTLTAIKTAIFSIPYIGWIAAGTVALVALIAKMKKMTIASSDVSKALLAQTEAIANLGRAEEAESEAAKALATAREAELEALEATQEQMEQVVVAQEALTRVNERVRDATDEVADAEKNLVQAHADVGTASQDVANTLLYVMGVSDELKVSYDDLSWASNIAQSAFQMLTTEMQGLQTEISGTQTAMDSLNDSVGANSRVMSENALAIATIRDAIRDRKDAVAEEIITLTARKDALQDSIRNDDKLTDKQVKNREAKIVAINDEIEALREQGTATEEERKSLRLLEGANRDLRLENSALRLEIEDYSKTLDEQGEKLTELQEGVDLLKTADNLLEGALGDVEDAESDLATAQETLNDTLDEQKEALGDVNEEWDEYRNLLDLANGQTAIAEQNESDLAQATLKVASSLEAQEAAYWNLVAAQDAEAARKQRASQQAFLSDEGIPYSDYGMDYAGGQQHGGRFEVRRPTAFIAGEGGPETVTVTRKVDQGGSGGGGTSISFHIGTFIGLDEESGRKLARATARYHLEELERRGVKV